MSLVAKKTETYSWISYAKLVDFILVKDDVQLPGHVSINTDNIEKSFSDEMERLKTGYGTYDAVTKIVNFGPWFDPIDESEIKAAILKELQ